MTANCALPRIPCWCGEPHYARGFCKYHYRKAVRKGEIAVKRKNGIPKPAPPLPPLRFEPVRLHLTPEDIFRSHCV